MIKRTITLLVSAFLLSAGAFAIASYSEFGSVRVENSEYINEYIDVRADLTGWEIAPDEEINALFAQKNGSKDSIQIVEEQPGSSQSASMNEKNYINNAVSSVLPELKASGYAVRNQAETTVIIGGQEHPAEKLEIGISGDSAYELISCVVADDYISLFSPTASSASADTGSASDGNSQDTVVISKAVDSRGVLCVTADEFVEMFTDMFYDMRTEDYDGDYRIIAWDNDEDNPSV